MVGVEEIASSNQLKLHPTSHPGQFKAHCPYCSDTGRQWHLYVSSNKDTFYCHKCGEKGGAIAFHAWLRGIDFNSAKEELYPSGTYRSVHPAERLTPEQLKEMGLPTYKPSYYPPVGWTKAEWEENRKRRLDMLWKMWCAHEKFKLEQTARLMKLILSAELETSSAV